MKNYQTPNCEVIYLEIEDAVLADSYGTYNAFEVDDIKDGGSLL